MGFDHYARDARLSHGRGVPGAGTARVKRDFVVREGASVGDRL